MGFSYDSESVILSSNEANINSDEGSEADETLEDSLVVQEVEPLIDCFADFASENVLLYYNPFFIFLLWIFYD